MTHATRIESLRTAINDLRDLTRASSERLTSENAKEIADQEKTCRESIEQITGRRAHELSIHEVSVLFGLSVTRLNRPWLSDFRKAHPDRVSVQRKYRLDDMLKLRQAYRKKTAGASERAITRRWGSEDERRNKAHLEDLDKIRRRLKESQNGKLQAALPHLEALFKLGCFVQRCTESIVYVTTQKLDFVLDADGAVVDSGVWPVLSRDEITDVLMGGGAVVGLTLHDALCLRWTDAKRAELWAELWNLGVKGTERLMAQGHMEGRQMRALSKTFGDQSDR